MSQRYRNYGAQDDPAEKIGDGYFLGVNQFISDENLPEGILQEATNMDFSDGEAKTRGGFVCMPDLAANPFGVSWDAQASAADNSWNSVARGAGLFVAVSSSGSGNRVMTSNDGKTWRIRASAADLAWNSICYGKGIFVAVASTNDANPIMTSPDGVVWTSRACSLAAGVLTGVTFGGDRFVAVGNNGAGSGYAFYSTDGIAWTSLGPATTSAQWTAVTYGDGTFVAVATTTGGAYAGYSVGGASDFITATTSVARSWTSVAYGNGLFVAVATSGTGTRVATSPTGDVWTVRTSAADNAWRGITFGGGRFAAVAETGTLTRVMTSTDGIVWATRANSTDNDWQAIAYGDGSFAAVSDTGTATRAMLEESIGVFASGYYSDPNLIGDSWIVLAGASSVGFYAFGKSSRSVAYPTGVTVTQQATIVQAGNYLFVFPGTGQTPLRWDGVWSSTFETVPASTLGVGFVSVPQSNQATYYQNRLWVVNGKDQVAASDALSFTEYDGIAADFNLNTGSADYVVCTVPFGDNALVVFKHSSAIMLENVQGSLTDVTATEISRNLGITGINAVTAVGPDLIYVSDRNITSIRLNIANKLQNVTQPLSKAINPIIERVNWPYAYKISMGYWNNLLFVAVPLDDATVCNSVLVYNFVTEQWYGEWNFAASINMAIQGFVVGDYLGQLRLHVVTEDGRIFVTDNGQNDLSGAVVAEISTSLTTRAYAMQDGDMQAPQRIYVDLATNRPNFTVTVYSDGVNEGTVELANQTYSRADSWLWKDTAYDLTNASDDFNRAYRKDYSTGPNSIQCGASGFMPEMEQHYRLPIITRRRGRLSWIKATNTTGVFHIHNIGIMSRPGDRSNRTQV